MDTPIIPKARLLALDVMRGITIVGMILFNTGSGHHFAPLCHAKWIGLTPADLAFPFFMFMMGITTFISLRKYEFKPTASTIKKIVTRAIGICLICIAFDWLHHFLFYWSNSDASLGLFSQIVDAASYWDGLRLSGVLVRLGLCYGLCALIAVFVKHKHIPSIVVCLLLLYSVILLMGNGFVRDDTNIIGIVDRSVLGLNHMWNDHGIDPEGLLSTIPSLAHVLIGFWVGKKISSFKQESGSLEKQIQYLLLFGVILLFSGYLLSYGLPISKKIWSPTFVLVTCGAGSALLGFLIYCIDLKQHKGKWTTFFKVFGVNPLFLYLLSEAILWILDLLEVKWNGESVDVWGILCLKLFTPVFGDYGGDLAFAIFIVLFCWFVGFLFYRKKIFIKL